MPDVPTGEGREVHRELPHDVLAIVERDLRQALGSDDRVHVFRKARFVVFARALRPDLVWIALVELSRCPLGAQLGERHPGRLGLALRQLPRAERLSELHGPLECLRVRCAGHALQDGVRLDGEPGFAHVAGNLAHLGFAPRDVGFRACNLVPLAAEGTETDPGFVGHGLPFTKPNVKAFRRAAIGGQPKAMLATASASANTIAASAVGVLPHLGSGKPTIGPEVSREMNESRPNIVGLHVSPIHPKEAGVLSAELERPLKPLTTPKLVGLERAICRFRGANRSSFRQCSFQVSKIGSRCSELLLVVDHLRALLNLPP